MRGRIFSCRRRFLVLLSTRQRTQELTPVHSVLERLATVDENYGHLVVVLLPQLRVKINVHFAPFEVGIALGLRQRLLDEVAEMTSLARIDHDVVHK